MGTQQAWYQRQPNRGQGSLQVGVFWVGAALAANRVYPELEGSTIRLQAGSYTVREAL